MDACWSEQAKLRIFTRPPGMTRAENQRRLDREIESLEAILVRAKEVRNYENALLTLPEELILRILLLVQDSPPSHAASHDRLRVRPNICTRCNPRTTWTGIFRVCRRLATLSLSTLLYRDISDQSVPPALYDRALARSGDASLNLSLHYGPDWSDNSITATRIYIKRNRARVQHLELHGLIAGSRFTNQFLPRLALFAGLKHLKVTNYRPLSLTPTPEPYIVPLDLGYQPILDWKPPPALDTLYLDGSAFQWKHSIYDNLLELTLVNISGRTRITVFTIVDLFARMKRIRKFALDHSDIELSHNSSHQNSYAQAIERARQFIIPPSSLRDLSITAPKVSDNALWIFPPSTTAAYTFTCLAPPETSPHFAARVLGTHSHTPCEASSLRHPPFASMSILLEDGPTALHARVCYSRTEDLDSASPDIALEYNIKDDHRIQAFLSVLYCDGAPGTMSTHLYCESIHQLSLDCACEYSLEDLTRFFALMPNLRMLRLTEDMLPNILPALMQVGEGTKGHGDTGVVDSFDPLCAPRLEVLHVKPSREYGFVSSEYTVHRLLYMHALRHGARSGFEMELRLPIVLKSQVQRFLEQQGWLQ